MAKKKSVPKLARTALVVLGMHRSGTSALAGVLSKMGADLPQDLMEPAEMNAKGFFESNRITGLNDAMLASAGCAWYSYDPVSPDWFASPKAAEFEARALEALEADYGRSHLFVVKDPRMCRLLPFWHGVFAQAGCRVLHVCIHRHPLEVAASLNRVSAYETDYAVQLWLRHVLEAEEASRGLARVFTGYDRLMADPVDVVTHVGSGLGLKWPRDPRTMAPELAEFISRDLRHFKDAERDATQHAALPDWVQQVLDILDRWVAQGEDKADHARLDQINEAVVGSASAVRTSIWQNQQKRWQLDALHKQVAELTDAAQKAREESASHAANHLTEQRMRGAVEAKLAGLDHSLQAEQQKRAPLEARIAELSQALEAARADAVSHAARNTQEQQARAEAESRLAELDQALQDQRTRAEALQAERAAEQQKRAPLEARIAELSQALEAARADAVSHAARNTQEQQARAEAESRLAELDQALQDQGITSAQTTAELQAQIAAEADRLLDLSNRFVSLEDEHNSLQEMLETMSQERDRLRSALEQSRAERDELYERARAEAGRIDGLESELSDLRAKHENLERKSERMARHLGAMTRQLMGRIGRNIDERLRRDEGRQEERAAEQQIRGQLESRLAELSQVLESAKADAASHAARHAQEHKARETAEARVTELDHALRAVQQEVELLKVHHSEARSALQNTEAHNQALLNSTSWRITAPLRGVVRRLRGQ